MKTFQDDYFFNIIEEILEQSQQTISYNMKDGKKLVEAIENCGILNYVIRPKNSTHMIAYFSLSKEEFDKLYEMFENLMLVGEN